MILTYIIILYKFYYITETVQIISDQYTITYSPTINCKGSYFQYTQFKYDRLLHTLNINIL